MSLFRGEKLGRPDPIHQPVVRTRPDLVARPRDRGTALGVKRSLILLVAMMLVVPVLAGPAGPAGAASSTPTLRVDGIGPLKLGMSRRAAVRTGWLSNRGRGCPLGGPPIPITYALGGHNAPDALTGVAEFNHGHLTNLSFTMGARTSRGVSVGRTSVWQMYARYRKAGYAVKVARAPTLGGTFVNVTRHGRRVIGGFAKGRTVGYLEIPGVSVCE